MAHLLILTTLDVLGRRNNREHQVIATLGPRFDHVTVVFRQRGATGKRAGDLFRSGVKVTVAGGVTYVAVDPPLNPPEGTIWGFVARDPGALRKLAGTALDAAAILRDRLTIRALTRAARAVLAPGTPVICEAFGPWATAAALDLQREGLVAHTVYVDRDFEPGFMTSRLRRAWAVRAEARAAQRADLTLSIGHRLARRFDGVADAQVRISPTGVDAARFTPRLRTTPDPRLIFVGQVAPWCGIEEVLDAMALLAGEMPDLHLTVLGPGEDVYLRSLEPKLAGLGARIDWRGDCPRDEVATALDGAAIGLATFRAHPLRIHAAPLKVLEYMSSGLPVIALEGSEAGDLVKATGAGITCATSGQAIAQAVRRLMSDPDAYARMSAAGPVASARHDWQVVLGREYEMLMALDAADMRQALA